MFGFILGYSLLKNENSVSLFSPLYFTNIVAFSWYEKRPLLVFRIIYFVLHRRIFRFGTTWGYSLNYLVNSPSVVIILCQMSVSQREDIGFWFWLILQISQILAASFKCYFLKMSEITASALKVKQGSQAVQSAGFLVLKALILPFRLVRCADTTKNNFTKPPNAVLARIQSSAPLFFDFSLSADCISRGEIVACCTREKQTGR